MKTDNFRAFETIQIPNTLMKTNHFRAFDDPQVYISITVALYSLQTIFCCRELCPLSATELLYSKYSCFQLPVRTDIWTNKNQKHFEMKNLTLFVLLTKLL